MNLYDRLEVSPSATPTEIKKHYRSLASRWHPDKPLGSENIMKAIQHAYDILSDPEKRARYDRTGDDEDRPAQQSQEEIVLSGLFARLVEKALTENFNMLTQAREWLVETINNATKLRIRVAKDKKQLDVLLKRITCEGETNYFEMAVLAKLQHAEIEIEKQNNIVEVSQHVLDSLKEYSETEIIPRIAGQAAIARTEAIMRQQENFIHNFRGFHTTA